MKPILYGPNETGFTTNGIGILGDCASCVVTEERNGIYDLEMQYPVSGIHYKDIKLRSLLLAKPNPTTDPQPFRVYEITRPINGLVTVYAHHISYDLAGIPVSPFTANSVVQALAGLKSNAATPCPFTFWTDKSTSANMRVDVPTSIWSLLGGTEGGILDVYGGEYEFDRYIVKLHGRRGYDRGVSIRYGKNMTDLRQEENCAAVYTGVYPYWSDAEGAMVTLPEKILYASGSYDFTRIMPLDLSEEWESAPTVDQLRSRAASYMESNKIGVPQVSIAVSFVPLEQTEEYKDMALLERVSLCDTVTVEFEQLGVSATAECIRTDYDVLLDRYREIEIGDARTNLTDVIVDQGKELQQKPDVTAVQAAILSMTASILGAKGGAVRLIDTNNDGMPDTLYIADDPDPTKAVKVWRFNYEGWGASKNGYNGPFVMGASLEKGFIADFITSGTIKTELLDVASILAENITATGIIYFDNGVYSMRYDPEDKRFWIQTHNAPIHMTADGGSITLSSQQQIYLQSDYEVLIHGKTQVKTFGQNITFDTTDVYGNSGYVSVNGKKLSFATDGTVRWEAT